MKRLDAEGRRRERSGEMVREDVRRRAEEKRDGERGCEEESRGVDGEKIARKGGKEGRERESEGIHVAHMLIAGRKITDRCSAAREN